MKASIAAAALLVVACSASDADFEAHVLSGGGDQYSVLIYDASGLIIDAGPAELQFPNGTDDVLAFPELQRLDITWLGGACEHQVRLEVTGNATDLRIDLTNTTDPNWLPFLPIACPAVGVPLSVSIWLNVPVEHDSVALEVNY